MTLAAKLSAIAATFLVAVVLSAIAGWWAGDDMRVDVSIAEVADEHGLARPNMIGVDVVNRGRVAVRPIFAVRWDTYPYRWSGPSLTLQPGERRRVELRTLAYDAMPPPIRPPSETPRLRHASRPVESVPFVVQVNHAGRGRTWQSRPRVAILADAPLANGSFRTWALTEARGAWWRAPAGWTPAFGREVPSDVEITALDVGEGVVFRVGQRPDDPTSSARPWKEAGLGQVVSIVRCPLLRIRSTAFPEFQSIDDGWPVLAAGVQVASADRADAVLWLPLSRIESRQYVLPSGTVVWQRQVDARGEAVVNLREVMTWLGSAAVEQEDERLVTVKVFLAAERAALGEHRFEVPSLTCEGGAQT